MTLPPLPSQLAAFASTQVLHCALNDLVKAYGQQCREAALEEAARLVEKYFDVNEPWINPHDIRELK